MFEILEISKCSEDFCLYIYKNLLIDNLTVVNDVGSSIFPPIYRDYFMESARVRFLLTRCEVS